MEVVLRGEPKHPGQQHRTSAEQCRLLEDRLNSIQRELEHSQRLASLGMVLGIIAHEFNNILTPMLSYAQMALDHPEDRDLAAKALRKAADGADKAAKIASSVLALARKEGYVGHGGPVPNHADVAHCLGEALSCLALDSGQSGGRLDVDIPPGCSAAIDPVALQQVFINLVLNAKKALREPRGRIAIRASSPAECSTWHTTDRDCTVIEIEDSGRGIEAEVLRRIFDPFVSAEPLERNDGSGSGTGLGLAICRQLIEAAGGTISATSTVGEGSCFRVVLPATVPQATPNPVPSH